MTDTAVHVLEDGKVFVDHGPVSMVITAREGSRMLTELAAESFPVICRALGELADALPILRLYPDKIRGKMSPGLPDQMVRAVRAVKEPTLTPMAAVAGAMADLVADYLEARGAATVIVNNGGDIALRIHERQGVRMGIVTDIGRGQTDEIVTIHEEDGIGGVCTSGLGGRSLTRGIANGVTVFSKRCIQADACATHIANCSYIRSPQVVTKKAGEADPSSDIPDLDIVTDVGVLIAEEIRQGIAQMEKEAERQHRMGNLVRVVADIQGKRLHYR